MHKCDVDFLGASIVEVNLAETEENRRWWPHFRDRRVDLYQDILKIWGND
jgi:N-carbamoylputrescine amidase